jgi:hypothetical protein
MRRGKGARSVCSLACNNTSPLPEKSMSFTSGGGAASRLFHGKPKRTTACLTPGDQPDLVWVPGVFSLCACSAKLNRPCGADRACPSCWPAGTAPMPRPHLPPLQAPFAAPPAATTLAGVNASHWATVGSPSATRIATARFPRIEAKGRSSIQIRSLRAGGGRGECEPLAQWKRCHSWLDQT